MSLSFESHSHVSQRRKTAVAAVQAFNDWSISAIMAFLSPTCIHEILPRSLGRPSMSNETYRTYFCDIAPFFRNFTVTLHDIVEDDAANKVVIWASSTAETDIGPYANEYMLLFYFNEAGDKIDRFLEFVDASVSVDFFPRLREYIVQKQGKPDGY